MSAPTTNDTFGRELSELVACTLTGANLKSQLERWSDLAEKFGIAREDTADGLRLTFEDRPVVLAELETLVDLENQCCSWAAWSVERSGEGVLTMTVRSKGEGIATLHGMFTSGTAPKSCCQDC
jgi:hypothetical protein